jgi:hypothetical protein
MKTEQSKAQSLKSKGQSPSSAGCGVRNAECGVRSAEQRRKSHQRRPAAGDYLSRFLCAGFVAVLLATAGCVGPRPLKGGKATTTRNQAGLIQQAVAQGENASQPSKQDQESIKVRTYTLPAATRIEQGPVTGGAMTVDCGPSKRNIQHPTSNIQHPESQVQSLKPGASGQSSVTSGQSSVVSGQ